ncbi:cobalamin biosynthesis protein [Pseudomonas citronellolis]|uniref:cobalamin biosynthesis protein n=1 Tax=Pseudomonas citronellolis TaxID=53408 RepID=UPI002112DA2D|nr:cobalamin biosynthesis protein [Pseudomonas citronellolis]MDN6871592.1 cobalamin biosynthesis protein [Pseudomonas citronellolis]UUC51090.1 cobalamin biosynthesis protein [Pseudomonas citronellolis]
MILVAGLGCRRGCGADELLALLRACLREAGLEEAALNALASSEAKALEGGLRDLSRQLRLPLELLDAQRLAPYEERLTSTSERARQVTGSAGVAEAAALALAEALAEGPARLVVPKRRSANATCALAMAPALMG